MLAALLVLMACSGEDEEKESAALDLPDGVTLTEGGSRLELGEKATVAYPQDAEDATALTVTVEEIRTGDIADFVLFSLSAEDAASTPYYVTLSVLNEGPGTPGTTSLPVFANDGENTLISANAIVGTFEPCPPQPIPAELPAGDEVEQCLVFLLPEGSSLASIDLQVDDAASALHWRPAK